jgi:hypothetical protein
MNVEMSRLNASVPGERSDLLNIPIRSRQIGKAQVSRGVCGELRDAGTIRNIFYDFGPRPFRDRPPGITTRFRKEQGDPIPAQFAPPPQIGCEQISGGGRIGDHSRPPVLSYLRPDRDHTVGRVDIGRLQTTKLFPPECGVIRQRQHHTVPARFRARRFNHRFPLLIVWNPWQLREPSLRDQRSSPIW